MKLVFFGTTLTAAMDSEALAEFVHKTLLESQGMLAAKEIAAKACIQLRVSVTTREVNRILYAGSGRDFEQGRHEKGRGVLWGLLQPPPAFDVRGGVREYSPDLPEVAEASALVYIPCNPESPAGPPPSPEFSADGSVPSAGFTSLKEFLSRTLAWELTVAPCLVLLAGEEGDLARLDTAAAALVALVRALNGAVFYRVS